MVSWRSGGPSGREGVWREEEEEEEENEEEGNMGQVEEGKSINMRIRTAKQLVQEETGYSPLSPSMPPSYSFPSS